MPWLGLRKLHVLFSAFLLFCLSMKITSVVLQLGPNPHWLFEVFSCAIIGISLYSKMQAKILPAMESRVML